MKAIATAIFMSLCLGAAASPAHAYSVLSHEAMIDAIWDRTIAPLLRARFHASADTVQHARAYAYGGCVIQDIGYYPFSSRKFGDLVHYVRTGDFVEALIADARTPDEYAFALGALAHYVGDAIGHERGINPSVPRIYVKYAKKFGDSMTYAQNPSAHLKTEFAFDVVQVARGKYAPTAFHEFVGFEIARPLLERAFEKTYGLPFDSVFADLDISIGSLRFAVGTAIPTMTKVAWQTKRDEIERLIPGVTEATFVQTWSREEFERRWGTTYRRPSALHKVLAVVLRVIPRVGPFKTLSFRAPTPETEQLFLKSFDAAVERYRTLVAAAGRGRIALENVNLDTGRPIRAGDYPLADTTTARWQEALRRRQDARRP